MEDPPITKVKPELDPFERVFVKTILKLKFHLTLLEPKSQTQNSHHQANLCIFSEA